MPKLLAVEVTRDKTGTWSHPDFKKHWNENLHKAHPDNGGSTEWFDAEEKAWQEFKKVRGL